MIILGGVNIYFVGIEVVFEEYVDIMEVVVFGILSEEWGESVYVVVVV